MAYSNTDSTVGKPSALSAAERDTLLGDELTRTLDDYARTPTDERRRALYAALVGRCASMAAAAVVPLYEQMEYLAARIRDLEAARNAN